MEKEKIDAINRMVPKLILEEIIVLREELLQYKIIKQKFKERRYSLLAKIEKSHFVGRILTVLMIALSKLTNVFKDSNAK